MNPDRSALGAFLRSRRDRLTPAEAGLAPFPGARRVPGLRKEELAFLVGVSADHYSRLEQGRQSVVAPDLVEALARALQLDEVETAHLHDLAAPMGARGRRAPEPPASAARSMLNLMTALDHVPTLLLGRRSEVLASDALLREVLGWEASPGSSFARWLLVDPAARSRIQNWSDFASSAVGALRFESGRHPDDAQLASLLQELRAADADVASWWDDQRVTFRPSTVKRIAHPLAGPLVFGVETVLSPAAPDRTLVVYTVEPDSSTARMLPLLASWASAPAPDHA